MKTRDLILKVAEEEFSKYGYDTVSMNDLVSKLGINKATIYYHFKDKKSLYQEILKDVLTNMNQKTEELLSQNLKPNDLFKAFIKNFVSDIKSRPSIISLILREMASYGVNVDDSIIPYIEKDLQMVETILKNLDLKDNYKDINPFAFISLINGTIKEFYVIYMSSLPIERNSNLKQNSEKTLDYISNFVTNIIFDAIVKTRS